MKIFTLFRKGYQPLAGKRALYGVECGVCKKDGENKALFDVLDTLTEASRILDYRKAIRLVETLDPAIDNLPGRAKNVTHHFRLAIVSRIANRACLQIDDLHSMARITLREHDQMLEPVKEFLLRYQGIGMLAQQRSFAGIRSQYGITKKEVAA
jgi:hypothetical protein